MSLNQDDLNRIIESQAGALLDALRSKTNKAGVNYGVAVAFCYPTEGFDSYYLYGTAAEQTPVSESTIFAIGSVTKTFTATLLAAAPFSYADSVGPYLAQYAGITPSTTINEIQLYMLAQQISGLRDNTNDPLDGDGLFQDPQPTPSASLQKLWNKYEGPPVPGHCWRYSDLGFITLGFAVVAGYGRQQQYQGATYSSLLQDIITTPLNMRSTGTGVPAGATVAQGHPNGGFCMASDASDLKSSISDMHQWLLQNLLALSVAQQNPLQQALAVTTQVNTFSPLKPKCGKDKEYVKYMGLAWQVNHLDMHNPDSPLVVWKDGLTEAGGCACWLGMIPNSQFPSAPHGIGLAVIVNGYWKDPNDAANNVIPDTYGWAMLEQIRAAIG